MCDASFFEILQNICIVILACFHLLHKNKVANPCITAGRVAPTIVYQKMDA